MKPWKHTVLHPELLKHKVRVLVVGCGGNGSAIAAGLPYLHQALLAYGHPEGIHVTLLDPDVISPTNCVRQPFSQSEIGLYKSVVLGQPPEPVLGPGLAGCSRTVRFETEARWRGHPSRLCRHSESSRSHCKVRRGLE